MTLVYIVLDADHDLTAFQTWVCISQVYMVFESRVLKKQYTLNDIFVFVISYPNGGFFRQSYLGEYMMAEMFIWGELLL